MRIAVMQAFSQREKNSLLFETVRGVAPGQEVVNFGVFPEEESRISYVQTALLAALLLNTGAVDFVVTGCSSGQGMMLACNHFPGVTCGYLPTPEDAFLFGRINDGNAASLPLGLGFGWSGEIRLRSTLEALFREPFGVGYPPEEAERKRADTEKLKRIGRLTRRAWKDILPELDPELVSGALERKNVVDYIVKHGTDHELVAMIVKLARERAD